MPMQTSSRILYDGVRNAIVQFTGVSDGSVETLEKKVDLSLLGNSVRRVKIMCIQYEVSGGLVRLYWEAADPVTILDLATVGEFDYSRSNGLLNDAGDSADVTGNILLSTIGFDIGSSYSIKMVLRKKT